MNIRLQNKCIWLKESYQIAKLKIRGVEHKGQIYFAENGYKSRHLI